MLLNSNSLNGSVIIRNKLSIGLALSGWDLWWLSRVGRRKTIQQLVGKVVK